MRRSGFGLVPDVLVEITEDVNVEDDRRDEGEIREEGVEDGDEEPAEDDVAEQSLDLRHVRALLEDVLLVEERPSGVSDHAHQRVPPPGVETGDEEVIEIHTDAQDGGVADRRDGQGERRFGEDGDGHPHQHGDEEVLLRVHPVGESASPSGVLCLPTRSPSVGKSGTPLLAGSDPRGMSASDWPHDPDGEEGSEGMRKYGQAVLAKKLDEEEDFPLSKADFLDAHGDEPVRLDYETVVSVAEIFEHVPEDEFEDIEAFHQAVGRGMRRGDMWFVDPETFPG